MAVGIFPDVGLDFATFLASRRPEGERPLQYKEIPVQAPAEEAGPQS
jgi:hypothetical protein